MDGEIWDSSTLAVLYVLLWLISNVHVSDVCMALDYPYIFMLLPSMVTKFIKQLHSDVSTNIVGIDAGFYLGLSSMSYTGVKMEPHWT